MSGSSRRFIIKGGVAVVTGAAGGIGLALATRLAAEGCHLALADIDEAGLAIAGHRLRRPGLDISTHRLDVGCRDAIESFAQRVLETHGRVTLLVNNAGIALGGTFAQLDLDDIERLIDINLLGVIRMTHALLPALQRAPSAHIVNMSSLFGIIAPPGQSAYAAAKFGVRGFSESLRHEMRGTPVGLTVVHPGGVRTNIANSMVMSKQLSDDEIASDRRLYARLLTLDPDEAAREIVEAIAHRRRRLVIGRDARQAVRMQRLFPVSYWSVAELLDPRIRRRRKPGASRLDPAKEQSSLGSLGVP